MNRYSQVFIEPSSGVSAAEVYRARREALLEKLDSFALFDGIERDPGTEEVYASTWTKFVQDPAFLYLTGVNQAGAKLVLDPLAENPADREVLFLPRKDLNKEFWTGAKLAYSDAMDDVLALTGFRTVLPAEEFGDFVMAMANRERTKHAYVFYLSFPQERREIRDDHNARFASLIRRVFVEKGIEVRPVADLHFRQRAVLDPLRIADARRAQLWTENAFRELLAQLPSFKNERQLGLFLDYRMQVQSDGDLAFPTIVACGRNACCLHYVKKDEPLEPGKLVLLDFGIRAGTQHSDISRTIPVSGKFNPLQLLLYGIVLDAQTFHRKQVKPGALLADLDPKVWKFIWDALQTRFVAKGGKFRLLYDKRPHGVSHLIGEQIHEGDPFRLYMQRPLEPGMLISDEPGLYGFFEIDLDGVHYAEDIGIRIEDDLLLTRDGCEDISRDIPREPEDLERLISGTNG